MFVNGTCQHSCEISLTSPWQIVYFGNNRSNTSIDYHTHMICNLFLWRQGITIVAEETPICHIRHMQNNVIQNGPSKTVAVEMGVYGSLKSRYSTQSSIQMLSTRICSLQQSRNARNAAKKCSVFSEGNLRFFCTPGEFDLYTNVNLSP